MPKGAQNGAFELLMMHFEAIFPGQVTILSRLVQYRYFMRDTYEHAILVFFLYVVDLEIRVVLLLKLKFSRSISMYQGM